MTIEAINQGIQQALDLGDQPEHITTQELQENILAPSVIGQFTEAEQGRLQELLTDIRENNVSAQSGVAAKLEDYIENTHTREELIDFWVIVGATAGGVTGAVVAGRFVPHPAFIGACALLGAVIEVGVAGSIDDSQIPQD